MDRLKEVLGHRASSLGFDRMFVSDLPPLDEWHRRAGQDPDPHWAGLNPFPQNLLPGAKRAVVLFRSYRPYLPRPGLVTLSAYYPCSQTAYQEAGKLADLLREEGFSALARPAIPYKPLVHLSGAGTYGLNGLTARPDMGSRYALQMILTDAPLQTDASLPGFDFSCQTCGECVRACPTGALEDGQVNMARCLRALEETKPIPLSLWPILGGSLLGCDLCQQICPRNKDIREEAMPPALAEALDLKTLLEGNIKGLIPFIGRNYARKKRLQARACILAANLQRRDVLDAIKPLTEDDFLPLQVHARQALEMLK